MRGGLPNHRLELDGPSPSTRAADPSSPPPRRGCRGCAVNCLRPRQWEAPSVATARSLCIPARQAARRKWATVEQRGQLRIVLPRGSQHRRTKTVELPGPLDSARRQDGPRGSDSHSAIRIELAGLPRPYERGLASTPLARRSGIFPHRQEGRVITTWRSCGERFGQLRMPKAPVEKQGSHRQGRHWASELRGGFSNHALSLNLEVTDALFHLVSVS